MNNFIILKIGEIVGCYYFGLKKNKKIIIYALGAPTVPDNGKLEGVSMFIDKGFDVFVPDYLGFGRSDGLFTPDNCIKTLVFLNNKFSKGVLGIDHYLNKEIFLKYKEIVFIGRSLGGAYVPLLPKYIKSLINIALFFPAVDQVSQGSIENEETNEDFMRTMKYSGYKHLYRGILLKCWPKHLESKDGLSPMENIHLLKNVRVFIAHGKKDSCISYKKSLKYYNKIIEKFPEKEKQFKLKIYNEGGHNSITTSKAIKDFLKWLE
ncbi:MAG: prolyl oligopeptidase family serine peptidase [Patescibacteria group bacterium]